jgi:hypothetical protein
MTQTPVSGLTTTITTLPDFAEGDHAQRMTAGIGRLVNLSLPRIGQDVERWLDWMLTGGTRPKSTVRATNVNGTNAYRTTQDVVCMMLDHYLACIDWDNPTHFKLIERATRRLPGTKPLV